VPTAKAEATEAAAVVPARGPFAVVAAMAVVFTMFVHSGYSVRLDISLDSSYGVIAQDISLDNLAES
jgi:hypothetical protein